MISVEIKSAILNSIDHDIREKKSRLSSWRKMDKTINNKRPYKYIDNCVKNKQINLSTRLFLYLTKKMD